MVDLETCMTHGMKFAGFTALVFYGRTECGHSLLWYFVRMDSARFKHPWLEIHLTLCIAMHACRDAHLKTQYCNICIVQIPPVMESAALYPLGL